MVGAIALDDLRMPAADNQREEGELGRTPRESRRGDLDVVTGTKGLFQENASALAKLRPTRSEPISRVPGWRDGVYRFHRRGAASSAWRVS